MEHIEQTIAEIKRELKQHPDDAQRMNELGVGYHLLGEYEQALRILQKAAALDGQNPVIYFNMGNTLAELSRPEEAKHQYMNAIERRPDYVPALANLADISEQTDDAERAEELFRYITSLQPTEAMGYFNLGNFYLRQNDTLEAGKAFEQATTHDPQFYEAYNNIGFILKHLGNYEAAIPYFERCLAIEPTYQPALDDLEACREMVETES